MTKDQMQKQYAELYEHYKAVCADWGKETKRCEQLSAENFDLKAKLEKAQRKLDALVYQVSLEDFFERPTVSVQNQ
jgi:hypothetical protein